MIDYTIYYKTQLPIDQEWPASCEWEVFISAFNSTERVNRVFEKAPSVEKHWLMIPDYGYNPLSTLREEFLLQILIERLTSFWHTQMMRILMLLIREFASISLDLSSHTCCF